MRITNRFKQSAMIVIEKYGNLDLVVSRTQKWNVQALSYIGDLQTLIKLPNGTNIKPNRLGVFRPLQKNEIKYQSLMSYTRK